LSHSGRLTAGLLDVGSQLGAYTLTAAKMGWPAMAVDPLLKNVKRLCRSATEGGLADKVDKALLFPAPRTRCLTKWGSYFVCLVQGGGTPCEVDPLGSSDSEMAEHIGDRLIPSFVNCLIVCVQSGIACFTHPSRFKTFRSEASVDLLKTRHWLRLRPS